MKNWKITSKHKIKTPEKSPQQKMCLVTQPCLTLCDPMDCSPPGSSVHGDSLGKNTGVSCYALLQGIYPSQGSNPGFPPCRHIFYCLSHQGSPLTLTAEEGGRRR